MLCGLLLFDAGVKVICVFMIRTVKKFEVVLLQTSEKLI